MQSIQWHLFLMNKKNFTFRILTMSSSEYAWAEQNTITKKQQQQQEESTRFKQMLEDLNYGYTRRQYNFISSYSYKT